MVHEKGCVYICVAFLICIVLIKILVHLDSGSLISLIYIIIPIIFFILYNYNYDNLKKKYIYTCILSNNMV